MTSGHWPSWRYGPKGEAAVFESEADVPKGWHDHPSKHAKGAEPEPKPAAKTEPKTRAAPKSKAGRKPKVKAPLDL